MLTEARARRLLGPGPVEHHIVHARGYAAVLAALNLRPFADQSTGSVPVPPRPEDGQPRMRILDLGSGGGIPGLVVAMDMPAARVVLLEAGLRRAEFLGWAIERCALVGRVAVLHRRAEEAGRDVSERGSYDAVVARSFGRPAVTAECAAPFLRIGGVLVSSEPPEDPAGSVGTNDPGRWPERELARLGMLPSSEMRGEFGFRVVPQGSICPERFPRRVGVPAKRPLF